MKRLLITVAFIFPLSFSLQASQLQVGNYMGKGTWQNTKGESGSYDVSLRIDKDNLESLYAFSNYSGNIGFGIQYTSDNEFDIIDFGLVVGKGSCIENKCEYKADLGFAFPILIQETIVFSQGSALRTGTKNNNGVVISWKEELALIVPR